MTSIKDLQTAFFRWSDTVVHVLYDTIVNGLLLILYLPVAKTSGSSLGISSHYFFRNFLSPAHLESSLSHFSKIPINFRPTSSFRSFYELIGPVNFKNTCTSLVNFFQPSSLISMFYPPIFFAKSKR